MFGKSASIAAAIVCSAIVSLPFAVRADSNTGGQSGLVRPGQTASYDVQQPISDCAVKFHVPATSEALRNMCGYHAFLSLGQNTAQSGTSASNGISANSVQTYDGTASRPPSGL